LNKVDRQLIEQVISELNGMRKDIRSLLRYVVVGLIALAGANVVDIASIVG